MSVVTLRIWAYTYYRNILCVIVRTHGSPSPLKKKETVNRYDVKQENVQIKRIHTR